MSFVSELKRRNVIRIGLAYLAGSWLLIQIVETLFDLFSLPDAAARIVVTVLAIGFIPAVIFAWVFELTPEGLKKDADVDRSEPTARGSGKKFDRAIMVVLVLALAYFAFDKFVLSESREETARQEGRSEALVESFGERSIAVLAFDNMSSDPEQEYMSDGIAEELLNLLAKIPKLRVISRSSSFSYKGKDVAIPIIAEELNVAHILEGSVRKYGNKIRITAQLIDARSDTHLWSETYDRELENIFDIQDEIAAAVVDELRIKILGSTPKLRKTDPEAYALYLQARYYIDSADSAEAYQMAIILCRRALEIDDQYAPAWVALSSAYANMPPTEAMPFSKSTVMARTAIQRALAIEPDNVIAISLNAVYSVWFDQDVATGVAEMRRALELAPSSLDAIKPAAFFLTMLGRHEESVNVQEYIAVREPLSVMSNINVVAAYYYAGRFEKVVSVVDENLAWFGDNDLIQSFYAVSILYSGDAERALGVADRQDVAIFRLGALAQVYYALGRQAEFETVFAELRDLFDTQPEAAIDIAWVYAYIGDVEQAFEWLDRAQANGTLSLYANDISFANLHDDPRWDVLMDELGMSQTTLDAIEFEVTLPR